MNKANPLLPEKKQGCEGLVGTSVVSGKKDKALPMSPSGSNKLHAELVGSESLIGSFVGVLAIKDCCRPPDRAK